MKTIAFVHDWLTGFAGAEQQLLALHEMYPDAPIYTSLYTPEKVPQFAKARVIPSYLQSFPGFLRRQQLLVPLMPAAFESFDLKGYDVIVSIGTGLSKGIIAQPGQRHIAFINTPMRYIWHLGGDTRASRGLAGWAAHHLRLWDVASAERVDEFLANSHTVAERIRKMYRRDSTVVFPPVNTSRFMPSNEPPGKYFLTVGRLIKYKRPDLIVEAFRKLKEPLKIVGDGPLKAQLEKMAADAPNIEFTGRLSDEELKKVYANARAFIFAAEEDFGIVPVEAMSAGRPVIAFGKGGATESVVEGKTGIFFPEQTADSLVEAVRSFKDENWDPKAIRAQAEKFDTEIFKQRMREIIGF